MKISYKPLAKRLIGSRSGQVYAWRRWAKVRAEALRGLRPVFRGLSIEWDMPEHTRLVTSEVAGPTRGQVLIRSIASAVSIGTERAYYGVAPNFGVRFPRNPGYSVAGEVYQVGEGVSHLRPGQLVTTGAPHASFALVPEEMVFPLPEGVSPDEAAFTSLGIIALHGIWRGELRGGERTAVLGRGPIGQLVIQLVKALGAGEVFSIAPSRRHCTPVLERFAQRVIATADEAADILDAVQADVTYEVSGNPRAMEDAVRSTRNGGRVVLLGTPRGITPDFDFANLADRGITLLGAHTSAMALKHVATRHDVRQAGETFLRLVAENAVDVRALIDIEINPWEAGWFYRELSLKNPDWVGALFRWDDLPDADRLQRVPYWKPLPAGGHSVWSPSAGIGREMAHNGRTAASTTMLHSETPPLQAKSAASRRTATPAQRTLRMAVIGCGARGSVAAMTVQQAEHTTLGMVMDVNESLASSWGARLGVRWTADYEAVLADDSIDVVYINTPHFVHAEQAVNAARSGKHIIVEKPLAHNLQDAASIVLAAREAQVQLSVWLGSIYLPGMVKAKQMIEAGVLGTILGAQLTHHLPQTAQHWSRGDSNAAFDWRNQRETAGGGVLIMDAIHTLVWLLYLSDMQVKEISAHCATLHSTGSVEDSAVIWLTFENGALATVNIASGVQGLRHKKYDCQMWGTEGHLSLEPPYHHRFYSSRPIDGKRPEQWHSLDPLPKLLNPDLEYLNRFAKRVLKGEPPEITGEDGLRLQAVIDAAYRSMAEGHPVLVDHSVA